MQFDEVAWRYVYAALDSVPRLFQLWACKQVLGLANTNATVFRWDKGVDPRCLSCGQAAETTEHIVMCMEAGRVDLFLQSVGLLDNRLASMDTEPQLRKCIVQFSHGQGYSRMGHDCPAEQAFQRMAQSQARIGWRQFMEGMVA